MPQACFDNAVFQRDDEEDEAKVIFRRAEFHGKVSFDHADFTGDEVDFEGAKFNFDGRVDDLNFYETNRRLPSPFDESSQSDYKPRKTGADERDTGQILHENTDAGMLFKIMCPNGDQVFDSDTFGRWIDTWTEAFPILGDKKTQLVDKADKAVEAVEYTSKIFKQLLRDVLGKEVNIDGIISAGRGCAACYCLKSRRNSLQGDTLSERPAQGESSNVRNVWEVETPARFSDVSFKDMDKVSFNFCEFRDAVGASRL